jgi:hypothetical protein
VLDPIDLAKGAANFQSADVSRLPIVGQIMEPGRSFHPPATSVLVQAIYDQDSIALLVRWHDMSAEKTGTNGPALKVPIEEEEATAAPKSDNPFGDAVVDQTQKPAAAADPFAEPEPAAAAKPSEFSDAVAVQIPSAVPTGARKPYFIFGDGQNSVDLWFFDLAKSEPSQYTGRGSASVTPNDTGDLTGVASYNEGEWSVIFKRPLRPSAGATFTPSGFLPIAFSVWDGFSRERGNRRGLTVWHSIYIEPEVVPSPLGPMLRTALLILAAELIVIGWVRWRSRAQTSLGRAPGQAAPTRA